MDKDLRNFIVLFGSIVFFVCVTICVIAYIDPPTKTFILDGQKYELRDNRILKVVNESAAHE